MSDFSDFIEDEEEEIVTFDNLSDAIDALMGGSAATFAVDQIGEELFNAIFGAQMDVPEIEGKNPLNIFGDGESRWAH